MNLQKTENVIMLSISLAVIAAVAAGVLACVDYITKKPREQADLKQTNEALKMLQPDFTNNPDEQKIYLLKNPDEKWIISSPEQAKKNPVKCVTFYPATNDGKMLSVIGKGISTKGYGGNMTVMVAMKTDGTIQNVIVTKNNETPGLGTVVVGRTREVTIENLLGSKKIDESELPPNQTLDQFKGLKYVPSKTDVKNKNEIPPNKWKVIKDGGDMNYVTGATISSRAVTFGVEKIVSTYYETKKEVLTAFKKEETGK